jgi:hypothetical protein
MNARADDLVVTLLDVLGRYPEATGLSVHALKAWAIVLIMASSDEAVNALNEQLGLAGPRSRSSRVDGGEVRRRRVSRVPSASWSPGPHHVGPPPGGNTGEPSS